MDTKSKSYHNPPHEFMDAMYNINPNFDYTNWAESCEWRFFLAGRKYELNQTVRKLSEIKKGLDNQGERL